MYVTEIQNIQYGNQSTTLEGLYMNRKKMTPERVADLKQ